LGTIGVGTKKHTFETDERSKIMDNHVELPALKTGHQTTFRSGKTNKWLGSLINGSTGLLFLISHWWSRCSLRLVNSSLTSSGVLCLGRGVGNSCDWSSFRDWMTRPGAKKKRYKFFVDFFCLVGLFVPVWIFEYWNGCGRGCDHDGDDTDETIEL